MIDWVLAQRLARLVGGEGDAPLPRSDLNELARLSETAVVGYTRLEPQRAIPAPEGVDRAGWIEANVRGMRTLLDPVMGRAAGGLGPMAPAMRIVAGAILTAEVGVILGFLSQRVLGQYELVLLDPAIEEREPRLLFVMPNLGSAVKSFGADEKEFMTWVALHEVTHAVQFAGVPWLQEHLAAQIKELLASAELRIDTKRALRFPGMDDLKRLVAAVRRGDIISFVASPDEKATLDRMQAAMAVIEGHAEHVMDAVGSKLLPSLPELREALERRRKTPSTAARVLQRLLGLEMKLRQYELGKKFCDAVVAAEGIEGLNQVWSSPAALPTPDELEDPDSWRRRMSGAAPALEAG